MSTNTAFSFNDTFSQCQRLSVSSKWSSIMFYWVVEHQNFANEWLTEKWHICVLTDEYLLVRNLALIIQQLLIHAESNANYVEMQFMLTYINSQNCDCHVKSDNTESLFKSEHTLSYVFI